MGNRIIQASDIAPILEKVGKALLELVARDIINIFKDEYLMKYVYNPNNPKVYPRTYDFLNAWAFSETKKLAATLVKVMSFDGASMSIDTGAFVHSSYYPKGEDVRLGMADILNKDGRSSSHPWSRKDGKPYWDIFVDEFVNGGRLDDLISKHASAVGLVDISFGVK